MKTVTLLLLIILFACDYFPQNKTRPDTVILDLGKSIDLAVKFNHNLKLAKLNTEIAGEQVREAWGSSVFPEISGFADYNRALKRGVVIIETPFFSGSFPSGAENTFTVGATLEQPLFTGAIFLAVRVAETYEAISNKIADATEAEVIVNVKRAYYSVLLAREVLELTNLNLRLSQNNLRNTETMFKAGVAPEYDYVRAKVQQQNITPEVRQAENSLVIAENLLKYVTGLELNQPIKITDSLSFRDIPVEEYDELQNVLISENNELKALELQVSLQEDNVSYQFTKHFPELYLNGSWQAQAQENDPRPFNQWRYNNSFYVGLNLRVPIFNGFQTTSKVEQARFDMMKAKEEYTRRTKELKNELTDVLLSIKQKKEELESRRETISEAQLAYDISVKRYSTGVGTQLETIDAMVALTRARVSYYTAIYDYYILNARLEQLLSTELN